MCGDVHHIQMSTTYHEIVTRTIENDRYSTNERTVVVRQYLHRDST